MTKLQVLGNRLLAIQLLVSVVGTSVADPTLAQDTLVRDAAVYTMGTAGTLKHADVLVHGARIAAVGTNLTAPSGATVIEAQGRALTPGLFGGLTTIGLEEISAEPDTVDATLNFKSPAWDQQWRPELNVTQAFNPRSLLVPVARIEGITWTMLTPGNGDSIVGGQGSAVSLSGSYDSILPASQSLFLQMGSAGAKLAGGSRAAEFMLLDQAVTEARTKSAPRAGTLLHPAGREALAHYLNGGRVVFQVDRAADIVGVIAFAARNGMQPIIAGGGEAWVVAAQLAAANVPVILDGLADLPIDFDHLDASLENATRLQRAGVRIAFSNGDGRNARLMRQLAGNAVAHGLPWDAALAAITSAPADIFGIASTRGRIAPGLSADLVLWSGDPLELSTLADAVWIAGKAVDMRSRQTDLRDRYLEEVKAHQAR